MIRWIKETYGISAVSMPEYDIWKAMRMRCRNPNNVSYVNYGGRGIEVCDRWYKSFSNFIQDVGKRPDSKLTLDRIDNNGNYEPGNVRWATRTVQQFNRNTPFKAKTHCKRGHELTKENIKIRYNRGWQERECLPCKKIRSTKKYIKK